MNVRAQRIALDDVPERLARHAFATCGDEQRIGSPLTEECCTAITQIAPQPVAGLGTKRHQPVLAAFAADHAHHPFVQADFHRLQRDDFRHAQAARIHQLDHGAVTQAERRVDIGRIDERLNLCFGQRLRIARRLLGRWQQARWIGGHHVLAQCPYEEPLEHRATSVGRGGAALGMACGKVVGQVAVFGFGDGFAALGQPVRVKRQVAPVRIERVAREAVFQPERIAETLDGIGTLRGQGRGFGVFWCSFSHISITPSWRSSQCLMFSR